MAGFWVLHEVKGGGGLPGQDPGCQPAFTDETWLDRSACCDYGRRVLSSAMVHRAGAQVMVCTNCPCPNATNHVVAQGQTDDAGYISLTFSAPFSPTGQGYAYCDQTTAPGYLTNFAYGVFPLTESGWSVHGLLPPITWGIALIRPESQQAEDPAIGATYDPARSILVTGGVFDCLGSPVPGSGVRVCVASGVTGVRRRVCNRPALTETERCRCC